MPQSLSQRAKTTTRHPKTDSWRQEWWCTSVSKLGSRETYVEQTGSCLHTEGHLPCGQYTDKLIFPPKQLLIVLLQLEDVVRE